jgi:SAM-dependent methyltransferase
MLVRARERLGAVVVHGDALRSPIATASVAHAVSVWVVHAVADPVLLFREAARVLRPGGRYIVCANQHPAPGDEVGRIIAAMTARVDERRGATRPRGVTVGEVREWGELAGFTSQTHQLQRQWHAPPSDELAAIAHRTWPAMRELDEAAIVEVTQPAIDALLALPSTATLRTATAGMIVFESAPRRG